MFLRAPRVEVSQLRPFQRITISVRSFFIQMVAVHLKILVCLLIVAWCIEHGYLVHVQFSLLTIRVVRPKIHDWIVWDDHKLPVVDWENLKHFFTLRFSQSINLWWDNLSGAAWLARACQFSCPSRENCIVEVQALKPAWNRTDPLYNAITESELRASELRF
jgi:hypothetical protein